jgi:hypothetical protein
MSQLDGNGPSRRVATLLEVSLNLTEPDTALLVPRSANAPALVTALLDTPASAQWASGEESLAAAEWIDHAARELNKSAIARSIAEVPHELSAEWQWPDQPLTRVCLDGSEIATADYFPASASAHWYLRWTGEAIASRSSTELPLIALATRVPEEAEEDAAIRKAILDVAIQAAANELTGRPSRLELADG